MTSLNTQLWELISNHKMPDDGSGKPFLEQLMDEHAISSMTAAAAIAEYRKFMYLCATRTERNVPSKAVDLVWHLHMQHSRDYWDVFCKKIGRPVHHSPGGERSQHLSDYKATVAAYKTLFGTPPKGIWKQSDKLGSLLTLIFLVPFIFVGAIDLAQGDQPIFMMLWLSIALFIFMTTLNGMTTKGELTLVFENSDPFANEDAGDCGSGDCGGCGD